MKVTHRMPALAFGLICLSAAPLHAKDDQGFNDYAKATFDPKNTCVSFVRKYESVCGTVDYDPGSKKTLTKTASNPTVLKSNCADLAPDQYPTVKLGQIIALRMQQAYINDFTERWETLLGQKRGEIAVVARVAEQGDGSDFDFSQGGIDRGRLVYYSGGVRAGQFLNLSQLPIFGPIEYNGKPVLLEFYILELDVQESTEISGLLSAAAGLGATAYPPASPILKVLDTIGSGLLKANNNDLELKYHATLQPRKSQLDGLMAGTLEYGNYAFVRMAPPDDKNDGEGGKQDSSHRWDEWYFNQANGRMYKDIKCQELMLDRTYFIVQINRGDEAASLNPENTFGKFMNTLTTQAQASLAEKVKIIDALKGTVQEEQAYNDAQKLISHAIRIRWAGGSPPPKSLDSPTRAKVKKLVEKIELSLNVAANITPLPSGAVIFDAARAKKLVEALNRLIGPGNLRLSPQAFDAVSVMTAIP